MSAPGPKFESRGTDLPDSVIEFLEADEVREALPWVSRHPELTSDGIVPRLKKELDRRLTEDPEKALRLSDLIDAVAAGTGLPEDRALALRARAQCRHSLCEYKEADRLYAEAIAVHESLGDAIEAARARKTRIGALMYLGRWDDAHAEAGRVREALDSEPSQRVLLAELDINVGNLLLRQGLVEDAIDSYRRAVELALTEGDETVEATARVNLANGLIEEFDFEGAREEFDRAGEIYERAGRNPLVADCRYGRLYLDLTRGDWGSVLAAADGVREALASYGHDHGAALTDLAKSLCLLDLGHPSAALDMAESATEVLERLDLSEESARAHLFAARALERVGRRQEAARRRQQALSCAAKESNPALTVRARLDAAVAARAQGRFDEARRFAEQAKLELRDTQARRLETQAEMVLALVDIEVGDVHVARRRIEAAEAALAGLEDPWVRLELLTVQAAVGQAIGDRRAEREALHEATEVVETLRDAVGASDMQLGLMRDRAAIYRRLVEMALDEADVDEALSVFERGRHGVIVAYGPRHGRSREVDSLRHRLQALYRRQAELENDSPAARETAERLWNAIRESESALAQVIRREEIEAHRTPRRIRPTTPIRRLAHADVAGLVYARCGDGYAAFVVTEDETQVVRIPAGKRIERLCRWLEFAWSIKARQAGNKKSIGAGMDVTSILSELGQRLLGPVLDRLGPEVCRLALVADGVLDTCPFGALEIEAQQLIDRFELVEGPSLSMLGRVARPSRASADGADVLIIGAEDVRAPEMVQEVTDLQEVWGPRCVVAPPNEVPQRLGERPWRVVHVAAHGAPRPDNPRFGGLVLDGGVLNIFELLDLDLKSAIVVLSGCGTAAVDRRFAGDQVGLSGGFLGAGAAAVVASRWVVEDASARSFMASLHRSLADGKRLEEAMHVAASDIRSRRTDPYFWAPWTVYGPPGALARP